MDEEEDRFELTLEGKTTRKFALPIVSVLQQEVKDISKFDFKNKNMLELDPNVVREGIENGSLISDSVVLKLHPD